MDKPTGFSRAAFLKGAAGAALALGTAPWITPAFAAVDESLEQAARNMGASPWRCFTTITLPLAVPGLDAERCMVWMQPEVTAS